MIIPPEQLITDLISENTKLRNELEQAQQDIKDFEKLAREWKDGYHELLHRSSVQIMHLEQTLKSVKQELAWLMAEHEGPET